MAIYVLYSTCVFYIGVLASYQQGYHGNSSY